MNFSLNWELNFIPSLGLDLLGLLSADCEHTFIGVSLPFVINIVVQNNISPYFINVSYQVPAPTQARVKTVRGSIMLVFLGEGTVDD